MSFKVRRIHRGKGGKWKVWRWAVEVFGPRKAKLLLIILVGAVVLFYGKALLSINIFGIEPRQLFSFGTLQSDDFGHTNILLLGVAGDGGEGGNLSDSIMIVSIDPKTPSVSFLSLPRDLFVSSQIGDRKINEVYAAARYKYGDDKGLNISRDSIEQFTGIPIHYGAVINFQVFQDLVDTIGGIDIYVPEDIVDPFYPDKDYGYQTFVIRRGLQHLNGAMALKYARSRKTTSDYSRAQRQQDILLAIRQRAAQLNLFTDFSKLKQFYGILKKNLNTDLGLSQVMALAKIGVSIDYENAVSSVLSDDSTLEGGFLYTPAQEFYGGQYVLLPKTPVDYQLFVDLILQQPEVLLEKAQISILNGSKVSGRAGDSAARLRRMGLHIIEVGNYDSIRPVARTYIEDYTNGKNPKTVEFLKKVFNAESRETPRPADEQSISDGLIDLRVVLGSS